MARRALWLQRPSTGGRAPCRHMCVAPVGAFGVSMGFRMSLMVLAIHRLVRSALVYRGRA